MLSGGHLAQGRPNVTRLRTKENITLWIPLLSSPIMSSKTQHVFEGQFVQNNRNDLIVHIPGQIARLGPAQRIVYYNGTYYEQASIGHLRERSESCTRLQRGDIPSLCCIH